MYWSGAEAVLERCRSGDFGVGAVPERRFRCRANRLLQHHISDSVTHFLEKLAVFEEIRAFFVGTDNFRSVSTKNVRGTQYTRFRGIRT